MLIAIILGILGSIFFGGSGADPLITKDTRKTVKSVIVEEAQREIVIKQLDRMKDAEKKARKTIRKELKIWLKLDKDHETDQETIKEILINAKRTREIAQKDFLDGLFTAKENMTKDQWETIFAHN